MEAKANYTLVGFFVLILTASTLIGGLWLSTSFHKKDYKNYTIYMKEPVSGLNRDAQVKYNGVPVGFVTDISLNPNNPQQVKLQVDIEEDTPVTTSTQATLINQGITGTTYIGLSSSSGSFIPLQKTQGEPYPVIPYKPSFLYQVEEALEDLSVQLKKVFDKENTNNIKQILSHLEQVSGVLSSDSPHIDETIKNLPSLISGLKKSISLFDVMAQNMSNAGKQVSNTMTAGRNSIQKVTQQAVPPAVQLLQKLNTIANNIEIISAQMRQNPAVVIRGSAPPHLGPGE